MARSTNKLFVGQLAPIQIKQPRQTSADDALGRSAENLRALELGSTLINLSMNENPEPPIELLQATQLWALQTANRYPIAVAQQLRDRLAQLHQLRPSQVMLVNGATEAVAIVPRALSSAGGDVVLASLTFGAYEACCKKAGLGVQIVPMRKDMGIDLAGHLERISEATRLVFVSNPNNPTGCCFSHDEFVAFLSAVPSSVVVVLDEAYADYVEGVRLPDSRALLDRYPNLIVLRTFSKSHGIAALRIGYVLGSEQWLARFEAARTPFTCNLMGIVAATTLIDHPSLILQTRQRNSRRRRLLEEIASEARFSFVPSQTNFLMVGTSPWSGLAIANHLRTRGVLVRSLDDQGMPQAVRIAVSTEEDLAVLRTQLLDIFAKERVS